jgi:hypothetical protein
MIILIFLHLYDSPLSNSQINKQSMGMQGMSMGMQACRADRFTVYNRAGRKLCFLFSIFSVWFLTLMSKMVR